MITSLLQQRTSVRKFQQRPVPEEVIEDMLEAARLSLSTSKRLFLRDSIGHGRHGFH